MPPMPPISEIRAAIAQQVADYIAKGGTITVLPSFTDSDSNPPMKLPVRLTNGGHSNVNQAS